MKFNIYLKTNLDFLMQTSYFKEQHSNTAIESLTISRVRVFTKTIGNSIISCTNSGGFPSSHVASKSTTQM